MAETSLALGTPSCTNLSIPISISSTVRRFPAHFNATAFNFSSAPYLPDAQVSGSYSIAASLCEPDAANSTRHHTLQILVHGRTYTRTYWSGLANPPETVAPETHSYIDYASAEGYPTLAIDRLCNGLSSHPNGSLACQNENQAAILHEMVDRARSGGFGGRKFSKIIIVGHSYGSLITQALTRLHPGAADAVVLTGFSDAFTASVMSNAEAGAFEGPPASQVDPARFGSLGPAYSLVTPESAYISGFYYGAYNVTVVQYNYNISGTSNLWESVTTALGQVPAEQFSGTVVVLNGEEDDRACPSSSSGHGDCGMGSSSLTAQAQRLYPKARTFSFYNTPDTGHVVNLHETRVESYRVIFGDLEKQGF